MAFTAPLALVSSPRRMAAAVPTIAAADATLLPNNNPQYLHYHHPHLRLSINNDSGSGSNSNYNSSSSSSNSNNNNRKVAASTSQTQDRNAFTWTHLAKKSFPSHRQASVVLKATRSTADSQRNINEEEEEGLIQKPLFRYWNTTTGALGSGDGGRYLGWARRVRDSLPPDGFVVLMSCAVGVLTGVGVVLFNYSVHEIHHIVWEGVPRASWLRDQPLELTWKRILFVPVGGGMVVGIVNSLRTSCEDSLKEKGKEKEASILYQIRKGLLPSLKACAAAITLGTGNSLGPEGPSVEIGASIAKGFSTAFKNNQERRLSLVAAGSAAGISSGFNAAVAGCFFAIESVLRRSASDSASSLTTTMLLLSSVLSSVVSQAGLGSDPAFKIPAYDFRSPAELPLYLLLGIICGGVSVALSKSCSYATFAFDSLQKATSIPAAFLPSLGGLCVGLVALVYPEVLYWGFENVDVLLESRPWARGPPVDLLLQLVGAKLLATSICRGSQLVGGIYAPSLFMGAALGSAYGKLVGYTLNHADPFYHLDALKVAAPQAYALVGMAAMLAGVCQVPLTSVLLLFELTRDYRIILPLMAAVGLSSWIASTSSPEKKEKFKRGNKPAGTNKQFKLEEQINQSQHFFPGPTSNLNSTSTELNQDPLRNSLLLHSSEKTDLCEVDFSLCLTYSSPVEDEMMERLPVSAAMRTNYLAVSSSTEVFEVMDLMVEQKEWCVLLVDSNHILEGLITLGDIQRQAENGITVSQQLELGRIAASAICGCFKSQDGASKVVCAYPDMNLRAVQQLMDAGGFRQLPVVKNNSLKGGCYVLGVIDRQSIMLACRLGVTRKMLGPPLPVSGKELEDDGAILQD